MSPIELDKQPLLEKLYLDKSKLLTLPPEVGDLKNLKSTHAGVHCIGLGTSKNLKTRFTGCTNIIDGDLKYKEVPTSFAFDTACEGLRLTSKKYYLMCPMVSRFASFCGVCTTTIIFAILQLFPSLPGSSTSFAELLFSRVCSYFTCDCKGLIFSWKSMSMLHCIMPFGVKKVEGYNIVGK
ncbi:Pyrophosphate--fructose 6-phosphate 1-phosphotransferase subunit beta [Artemisia annua]|uniref:Pyrophosphate--fructose 6-phosphate 1-phosphotransferase subunit beta n=1 Tax=Artemisia annua TaxID=35608 RepID=A0A2U1KI84_ARTAN|nr:Pyrophosphate--fructose 6-phosphate 1-phosphotransferase subunit beta [Artemisia annua]